MAVFETPDDRTKSDAVRRRGQRTSTRRGVTRFIRPALESLEARLLLSGSDDSPESYLFPPPSSFPIPLAKEVVLVPYGEGNPPIDPTFAFPNESGLGIGREFSSPSGPLGGPSHLLAVYDEIDPSHMYAMKTVDYTPSIDDASFASAEVGFAGATMMTPAPRMQIVGTLTGPAVPVEYRIPLNPAIEGLRFGLTSLDRSSQARLPYFDSVSIYDQYGQKLAEMSSGWEPDHSFLRTMLVSLGDVTSGWSLVVRISSRSSGASALAEAISNSTGGSSGDLASSSLFQQEDLNGTGSTSYVLTVEEYKAAISSGTVGLMSNRITDSMSWSIATGSTRDDVSRESSPTPDTHSKSEKADSIDDLEETTSPKGGSTVNVRIPTGPLVNRGGTAFGGILANDLSDEDTAPTVERFDQLLLASLDSLGHQIDSTRIRGRADFEIDSKSSDRTIDPDAEFVVVGRTPGDLPLVASETMGPLAPEQAAAFFATLPSPAGSEVPVSDPIPGWADNLAVEPKQEEPGWSSTALGLVISLTVSSGAYLPAFMARLRRSRLRRPKRSKRQTPRKSQG